MSISNIGSGSSAQLLQLLQQQIAATTSDGNPTAAAADGTDTAAETGQDLPADGAPVGSSDPSTTAAASTLDPALSPANISQLLLELQIQQSSLDTTLLLGGNPGQTGNTLVDYLTGDDGTTGKTLVDYLNDDGSNGSNDGSQTDGFGAGIDATVASANQTLETYMEGLKQSQANDGTASPDSLMSKRQRRPRSTRNSGTHGGPRRHIRAID